MQTSKQLVSDTILRQKAVQSLNQASDSALSWNLSGLALLSLVSIGIFNVPVALAFSVAAALGLLSVKQSKEAYDSTSKKALESPLDELPAIVPPPDRDEFDSMVEAIKHTGIDTKKCTKDSLSTFIAEQLSEHKKHATLALPESKGVGDFWHPSILVESEILQPLILLGGSGCGKTLAATHYLKALNDVKPDYEIWYASPVDRPEDSGIERFVDQLFVAPLNRTHTKSVTHTVEFYGILQTMVHKFLNCEKGLFFLDEYPTLFLIAEWLKKQHNDEFAVQVMAEIGHHITNANNNERDRKFMIAGQTGAIEAYGLKRFNVGNTQPIFFSDRSAFSSTIWQTATTNKFAPQKAPTQEQLEYWQSIGAVKICGYAGAWHPVANLKTPEPTRNTYLYSGFPTASDGDVSLVDVITTLDIDEPKTEKTDVMPTIEVVESINDCPISASILAYLGVCESRYGVGCWRSATNIKKSLRAKGSIQSNYDADPVLGELVKRNQLRERSITNKNKSQTIEYQLVQKM